MRIMQKARSSLLLAVGHLGQGEASWLAGVGRALGWGGIVLVLAPLPHSEISCLLQLLSLQTCPGRSRRRSWKV